MDRMLYVAMAAARQTMQAQSVATNNLANINTTGFRRDMEASISLGVNGAGHASRAYSLLVGRGVDTSSSSIVHTGDSLDIAVNGDGWIAVQANDGGEAYTRDGDLRVDGTGLLTTASGHPVLGNTGPIVLPPFNRIDIGADGTLSILPEGGDNAALVVIDRIRLVSLPEGGLVKGSDGLIRTPNGEAGIDDARIRLVTGGLESSNVNGVEEMVRQIELARRFDVQVRMMNAAQELDEATDRLLRMT